MHVFTFNVKKISLDYDERQWVVDCVRQPRKKTMSNSSPLIRGGKFEFQALMVFPRAGKEHFTP